MKKSRVVFGMILDFLIVAVLGFAFLNGYFRFFGNTQWIENIHFFNYYTNDSCVFLGISALLSFFAGIGPLTGRKPSRFFAGLKLMAVTATTITMITVLAYLAPRQGWWLVYEPTYNLYVHTVAPALGFISFLVSNRPKLRWPHAFLAIIPPALYAGIIVPLIELNVFTDPYGFLKFDSSQPWISVAWYGGFLVAAFLIALILLLIHNIGRDEAEPVPAAEEAPAEEPAPAVEETPAEGQAKPVAEEPVEAPVSTSEAPRTVHRTYHITKKPSGKWQVKLANGEKAIRLFDTQAEAIAFTKGLVESRGGSYRIHSVKGKIRK